MGQRQGMASKRRPTRPGAGRDPESGAVHAVSGHFRTWVGVAIVLVATAILYVPALNNGFTNWDDDRQVTANPDVRDLSVGGVRRMFSSFTVSLYQPLTSLAFALEYRLFGLDARAYHAVNVLVHLANILLVYGFVRSLSQRTSLAVVAAALFAVHPLQVEAVAWVSSLSILLSSLFYLGAMMAYLAYARSGQARHFAAVCGLFVLALLAKTSAATLPLVLWVIDIYLQRRPLRRVLCEKVPLLVLSLVFGYVALCARSGASHVQDFAMRYSLFQRASIVSYSCLWYLGKLVFPVGLSAFYPFPGKIDGWLPVLFYAAPVLLIGLAVGVWHSGPSRRLLAFTALFMLASLALVVQVVPISELMVCDRYAYLPCIGLFFLVGTLSLRIWSRGLLWKAVTLVGLGLVLTGLAGATFGRIEVWHDSLTLWNDVIGRHADIWSAYLNRGLAESQTGDYKAAIEDFDAALRLNPHSEMALNNRAGCHTYLGNWPAALRDFDSAIQLKPDSDYLINRGILRQKMGDSAGALKDFDAVIQVHPRNIRALCERADSYRLSGNWTKAIEDYNALLGLYPGHSHAAFWLGVGLLETGDPERAAALLNRAIALGCKEPGAAYFLLGKAYQRLGRKDLAIEALRRSHETGDARALVELHRIEGK